MSKQGITIIPGIIIVVALVVVLSLPGEDVDDLTSITIVANLPITGPGSSIGIEERDGLQLAIAELNSSGGINDKNIELVIVDNETDLEKAKEVFLETEQTYNPLFHITSLSSISTAISPLAEENKVVLIALSAVAPGVTKDKEWTFRYFPMADVEAGPILQTLDELNIKNLGILYLNDEYGRAVSKEVTARFESIEGVVTNQPFEPNTVDLTQQITNLQNEDAIYVIAFPDYVELIFKELRKSNYSGEILSASDGVTFKILSMSETNGVYLAAPANYNSNFQLANQIAYQFESTYNKQFDHNAANSYDLIRIIHALLDEEEMSRDSVKDNLSSGFIYSGIFGTVKVFPKNHDISFDLFPAKVVDGGLQFKSKVIGGN